MDRNLFDKSNYGFTVGQIGQLQTICSPIPVIAGDSVSLNVAGLMRLSPLRRTLMVDAQVDYFGFFVPQRHIYTDWEEFIQDGHKNTVTFPETTFGAAENAFFCGVNQNVSSSWQLYINEGYNKIWNRYFRYLKLTPEIPLGYYGQGTPTGHTSTNSPLAGTTKQRAFGYNCARLKRAWNTGVVTRLVDADVEAPVTNSGTTLDIIDLLKTKQYYKTELQREYFADRYSDIMKNVYGSGVNTDADERPTLLFRQTQSVSAHDVDGTDDANLGTYSGKALSGHRFGLKRKYFNEHGTIFIMALVRFPTIPAYETNPLYKGLTDQYNRFSADYNTNISERPATTKVSDWFNDSSSSTLLGTIPYGQWWREQPNFVHQTMTALDGFPFLATADVDTHMKAIYHHQDDYTAVFQTEQLAQWQLQAAIQLKTFSHYPTTLQSIFTGVK